MDRKQTFFRKLIVYPIVLYKKLISPFLPRACIYQPTCSEYLRDAILKFGFFKGSLLGFLRILRCNPFFKGGEDRVSESLTFKEAFKKFLKFSAFR